MGKWEKRILLSELTKRKNGGEEIMEERLQTGFTVNTIYGRTVRVEKLLGEGGQGAVYLVNYGGEQKALKWFKKSSLGKKARAFYENIRQNIEKKAPSPQFLWPLAITEWVDGTFGYVMDLRPEGYYELTEYMCCDVRFKSYRTAVNAALEIVSAFRILHNAGYSYQDLNDGNFFINPENGKVLICDNDNVAPDRTEMGIAGKPRYMAPEIVLGKSAPNSLTDRFSMSVILYILFCLNHPLEGKRYIKPYLSAKEEHKIYGSEPIFMMDPDDRRNAPHPVVHRNSLMVWACLPDYVRDIFLKAFSKRAFDRPSSRPSEKDWLNVLTRFRSEIVPCACGNEIFTQQGKPCRCDACRRPAEIPYRIAVGGYNIPAVSGSRIYRCQLGICDEKDALDLVAQVLHKKDSNIWGIKNKSEKRWKMINSAGNEQRILPDEIVPLANGMTFYAFEEKFMVLENKK